MNVIQLIGAQFILMGLLGLAWCAVRAAKGKNNV